MSTSGPSPIFSLDSPTCKENQSVPSPSFGSSLLVPFLKTNIVFDNGHAPVFWGVALPWPSNPTGKEEEDMLLFF
jgi:hypothetical protein